MPLSSHTCDSTPARSTVEQRGQQFDCNESSCRPTENSATAWNRQRGIAKSAGESAERYTATEFRTRGRSSSL